MAQKQGGKTRSGSRNGRVNPAELARVGRSRVAELTGRSAESVLGIRQDDDGWKVTVEVVELSRIPSSTDLLGCYVVTLDDDGELIAYERVRRYQRGQAGGGDQ
ncbi:MAG TPA: gas vesicle protein [Solirubrobacteraceae bacterium]